VSDPLGRRALFSPPPEAARPSSAASAGKESLFSASAGSRSWGTVVVDCSACGGRSRLSWVEFFRRHLPLWLWLPWLRYSNLMSCPACEQRTWLGVSWLS
jgi:hypothetical protein